MKAYDWALTTIPSEAWVYLPDFLTDEQCDMIIEGGKKLETEEGKINSGSTSEKVRKSTIGFFPTNNGEYDWLFQRVASAINDINKDFYNYDLEKIEALQFTEYSSDTKGFYGKHLDIGNNYPKHRKLSFSVQLSDPESYEGGDLVLHYGNDPVVAHRTRGTLILFTSWLLHEVTPVTKGVRHSLVGWIMGPPFK